jgi:hypothetical protein
MADRRYNPLLGLLGLGDAGDIASGIGRSASKALFPFANAPDPAIEGQRAALRGDVPPPAPPPPPANDPGFAPPHPTRREMVTRDPEIEGQKLGITGRSMTSRFPQQPDRNLDALRRNQEQSFLRPLMQTSGRPLSAADVEDRQRGMDVLDSFHGTEDELRGDHQADTFQNEQFETALAEQDQKQSLADTLALDPFAREKAVAETQLGYHRGIQDINREEMQTRRSNYLSTISDLQNKHQQALQRVRNNPNLSPEQKKSQESEMAALLKDLVDQAGVAHGFQAGRNADAFEGIDGGGRPRI